LGPALELSTLGCSSTYNNTLHVLQRTALGPHLLRLCGERPNCMRKEAAIAREGWGA